MHRKQIVGDCKSISDPLSGRTAACKKEVLESQIEKEEKVDLQESIDDNEIAGELLLDDAYRYTVSSTIDYTRVIYTIMILISAAIKIVFPFLQIVKTREHLPVRYRVTHRI